MQINMMIESKEKPAALKIPRWFIGIAIFSMSGMLLGLISKLNDVDIDLFHEITLFREFLKNGSIPKNDVFSYIPTVTPVVHHEWGSGAVLYFSAIGSGLGSAGLMLLKYIITAAILIGCYLFVSREKNQLLIFSWLAPIMIGMGSFAFKTIRAQLFSILFLILLFHILEKDRQGKRRWILVWLVLYVIWLNMHAGFLIGLGFFFFYMIERFISEIADTGRPAKSFTQNSYLLLVFFAMLALILVNPFGFDYLAYLWKAVFLTRSELILEWRPLWQQPIAFYIMPIYILSLIILTYAITQHKFLRLRGIFFLSVTGWLSLGHFRYLPIYAVAWLCYLPGYLKNTPAERFLLRTSTNKKGLIMAIWIVTGLAGSVFAISNQFWKLRIPTTREEAIITYPAGVVTYLAEQEFTGNLMVHLYEGSYISWKLYPKVKISMDSRFATAYSYESILENLNFYVAGDGWQETLNRYDTQAVLIRRLYPIAKIFEQSDLTTQFQELLNWRRVYIDDEYALFVKSELADKLLRVDRTGQQIHATFP